MKLSSSRSPSPRRRRVFSRVKLILVLLTCVSIMVIFSTLYYAEQDTVLPDPEILLDKVHNQSKKVVIFPRNFHLKNDKLIGYYTGILDQELSPDDIIFKNRFNHKLQGVSYRPTTIEVFKSSEDPQCENRSSNLNIEVSQPFNKNANLYKILTKFKEDNSDYYKEMKIFFPNLEHELNTGIIQKHWFQLIGSSVWLQQYGVHLMINRVFYTKTGDKVKPNMSLAYVRIFDRNWQELENVDLIVPDESESFKVISYPNFLPIPVYHSVKQQDGRFYGIEDPRIMLIKNNERYEEPVIVFNSHNRKISRIASYKDTKSTIHLKPYRSMFIGWLWRSQKGKSNIDDIPSRVTSNSNYVKVKELKLPKNERFKKEKNWTPFLNYQQQLDNGYDVDLYLVYQFEDLKILKCSLLNDKSECTWEYQLVEESSPKINKLRGGTELVNVNQILAKSKFRELRRIKNQMAQDKQIWIGFARAVLKDCGCGVKMYRPNMVVLIKEEGTYRVSHVSSYADLEVPILPWNQNRNMCEGKNLLIPNGISSWNFAKDEFGTLQDYMTLSLSRADSTIDIIHIKGILISILDEEHLSVDVATTKNDNNIKCAIKKSQDYCVAYGKDNYDKSINSLAAELKQHMDDIGSQL